MDPQLNTVITSGLTVGSIYGLIGIGFVMVVRATGVVSFAQSGFMVLGALVLGSLLNRGLPLPGALLVSVLALAMVGALTYRLVFARLVGSEVFVTSVATIGVALLIQSVCAMVWGTSQIVVPEQFGYEPRGVLGLTFTTVSIFVVLVAVTTFALVLVFLQRTPVGLRMRAVASDSRLAAYLGVNVVGMSVLAWAIAAGTGSLAGSVYLLSSGPDPGTIYALGLAAFPAILLGGFDSVGGALAGGILIGLLQASISTYMSSEWQVVAGYLVLLVVLLVRPQGIFGSKEVVRV